MKALSTTILIVVTAVVILVAALVVLTIFGGGMGNVTTLTSFRTQCATQCQMTCKMGGALPPTWDVSVNVEGTTKKCSDVIGGCNSAECGGASITTPGALTGCCKYGNTCIITTQTDCQSKSGGFNVGNYKCQNNNCVPG
jgi:hypothetical protein